LTGRCCRVSRCDADYRIVSYYLPKILDSIGITGQREQTRLNGIVTTVYYVTSVMAVILASKVGRRWLFVGGGTFMWLSLVGFSTSVAVYNEKKSAAAGRSSLGFIFILNTGYNFCLIPTLYLYSTEILPYRLRAMGISISVFTTKSSLFFNQFVNPIGLASIGWKYYFVYVGWVAVEVLIMFFFFPETKGHSLETMPEVFGEHVLDNVDSKLVEHEDARELGSVSGGPDKGVAYVEHIQRA
jgi:MFS family permease